jgi:hypothetical protein
MSFQPSAYKVLIHNLALRSLLEIDTKKILTSDFKTARITQHDNMAPDWQGADKMGRIIGKVARRLSSGCEHYAVAPRRSIVLIGYRQNEGPG